MRVLLSVLLFAFLVVSTSSLLRDVGPRAPDDQQDSDLTVEEILPEEPQETGIEALQQAVAQTQNILRSFVEHLDKGCLHSDEVPKEKEEADANAPSQSGTDDILWEMKGADAFGRFNLEDDMISIPKGADAFRRFNLEDDMIRIPKRSNIDFHHVGKRETHDCSECLPGEDGDPGYPGRPGMPGLKGEPGDVGPPGPPGRSEWRRRRPSHRDHRRHRGTHEDRWDRGTHRHVRSIDRADLYPEDNFDRPRGPPARPAGPPIKGPKGERGDDGYPGLPGLDGLEGAPGTFRDRTYEHVESVVRNYIKDTCTCKAEHRNH